MNDDSIKFIKAEILPDGQGPVWRLGERRDRPDTNHEWTIDKMLTLATIVLEGRDDDEYDEGR